MSDVLDLMRLQDPDSVMRVAIATRAQLLDAITRELAGLGTGYAEHVRHLADAYARLTEAS
jgi:hypothetical protein